MLWIRVQELCGSRCGRPVFPVPNSPEGLNGRETTLKRIQNLRVQELCESRGGHPGLPVPNSPYGLGWCKAIVNERTCCEDVDDTQSVTRRTDNAARPILNSATAISDQRHVCITHSSIIHLYWCRPHLCASSRHTLFYGWANRLVTLAARR